MNVSEINGKLMKIVDRFFCFDDKNYLPLNSCKVKCSATMLDK